MKDVLVMFGIVLLYLGFLSLVAWAVWFTGSAWCLWALLLTPSMRYKDDGQE